MTAERIEHVVVLMLENRSFDHMLGFMDGPGLEPLTGQEQVPVDPHDPAAGTASPFVVSAGYDVSADPRHGYEDVMAQLSGQDGPWSAPYELPMNGFVWNYRVRRTNDVSAAKQILGCHTGAHLPALWALAREFAMCTRWFCSLPSETWPNRLFAHAATSDATIRNEIRFYTNPTIFEKLSKAGREWRIYAGDIPQVAAYRHLLWHPHHDRFDFLDVFERDAESGRLPAYSFLEPHHFVGANSQHPPQHVGAGDDLVRWVYGALTRNPETWRKSLLLVVYDEHGGFYDRVAPLSAVPPVEGMRDRVRGFPFDLLGPRVPAVVVSPYVPRRADATVYDHTSIIATLRELFGVPEQLTDRDGAAATLTPLLTLGKARDPEPLPPALHDREELVAQSPESWAAGVDASGEIQLNDLQRDLVQLKLLLDETLARERPESVELTATPAVGPPFHSAAEVDAFVADFQRRHIATS